jgi:hypothetical protein
MESEDQVQPISIHHWIQWIKTWTFITSFGYLVDHKPKLLFELEKLYEHSSHHTEKIKELGNKLFGTNDYSTITSYVSNVEYTLRNQQPSITHSVYIIHSDVFDKRDTNFYLDDLFMLYRQGHSELHSIMSPVELPQATYWYKRQCEFGFVYHHPDYICYRIQLFPNDRPYNHVLTNAISSYSRYLPNHSMETLEGTIGEFTKIMFVMNDYEEEFPQSLLYSLIDYDTPICFFGIIPYIIPRLPSHLFELQYCYLFPDCEEIYFYVLRVVYHVIPESVQEIIRMKLINIENKIDLLTLDMFQEEWLQEYQSKPNHFVKVTIFSPEINLVVSKKMNQLLFEKK